MSIFHAASLNCPQCGTVAQVERTASVNADRRPDLREAIKDGTFQAVECEKCGTPLRLPPHFTYLDVGRGSWILVEPPSLLEQWPTVEDEVFEVYDHAFGESAPEIAQDIGADLLPRLVFGWMALREKLICQDLDLDDTTLELLKMAIMRDVNEPPIADQTELRLVGGDETQLHFLWVETALERGIAGLSVPRDIYGSIIQDPAPWEGARAKFENVFLVDLRRLIEGPEDPDQPEEEAAEA
jgi:CpXC protein